MFDSAKALLKELEACNKEELLQEDLRIKDGNVGSPADKGVGCVGQGMNDIISHKITVFVLKYWQQQVLNHLSIHRTWNRQEKDRLSRARSGPLGVPQSIIDLYI